MDAKEARAAAEICLRQNVESEKHVALIKHPDDWTFIGKGMSNFDLSIDDGLAMTLAHGEVVSQHAAWNFCGYVFHNDGKFFEEVWIDNAHVATHAADNLEDLMRVVNEEFGCE